MNKPAERKRPGEPRPAEDESDPRQRILEAAYHIFAEKGREGARTREIAKLAGVNVAMLHYYFSSKEELYVRVLTPIFETVFIRLQHAATSHRDPRRRLEAVVNVYFDVLKHHPDLPRLVMWELVTGAEALQKTFRRLLPSYRENLLKSVHEIFQEGRRKPHAPHEADHAFVSMVALCIFPFIARPMLQIINPELVNRPEFLDERQRHVLDLLLRSFDAEYPKK